MVEILEMIDTTSAPYAPPKQGIYCGFIAAVLVSMAAQVSEGPVALSVEDIIPLALKICEEKILERDVLDETFKFLCSQNFLKCRTKNQNSFYQITPTGIEKANELHLFNMWSDKNMENEYISSYGDGEDGVFIVIDDREGSGDSCSLFKITQFLKRRKVKFLVKSLHIGDYQFKIKKGNIETNIPCLIERKRTDDLAKSICDGRFISQKRRMLSIARNDPTMLLYYIVEGNLDYYRDAIRHESLTIEDVREAIANTEQEGFLVVKTENLANTLLWLIQLAKSFEKT